MHSETIKATVVSLYANGRSFNSVAQELKLTKGQVAGIIFRYRALYGEARDGIGKPLRAGAHQHDVSLSSPVVVKNKDGSALIFENQNALDIWRLTGQDKAPYPISISARKK